MGSRGASSGRASIGSNGKNNEVEDIRTAIRNRMIEQGRVEREFRMRLLQKDNSKYGKAAKELLSKQSRSEASLYLMEHTELEIRGIAKKLNYTMLPRREPNERTKNRVIQSILESALMQF